MGKQMEGVAGSTQWEVYTSRRKPEISVVYPPTHPSIHPSIPYQVKESVCSWLPAIQREPTGTCQLQELSIAIVLSKESGVCPASSSTQPLLLPYLLTRKSYGIRKLCRVGETAGECLFGTENARERHHSWRPQVNSSSSNYSALPQYRDIFSRFRRYEWIDALLHPCIEKKNPLLADDSEIKWLCRFYNYGCENVSVYAYPIYRVIQS